MEKPTLDRETYGHGLSLYPTETNNEGGESSAGGGEGTESFQCQ